MTTIFRWTGGPFEDTIVSEKGTVLPPHVFTKLHPKMAILDAAADEDGEAYVKGVGFRKEYRPDRAIKYDIDES